MIPRRLRERLMDPPPRGTFHAFLRGVRHGRSDTLNQIERDAELTFRSDIINPVMDIVDAIRAEWNIPAAEEQK